jgi:hypothetical protein
MDSVFRTATVSIPVRSVRTCRQFRSLSSKLKGKSDSDWRGLDCAIFWAARCVVAWYQSSDKPKAKCGRLDCRVRLIKCVPLAA